MAGGRGEIVAANNDERVEGMSWGEEEGYCLTAFLGPK